MRDSQPNFSHPQQSLSEICFQSASENYDQDARDQYEDLATERRKLKRQLKEMGEEIVQQTSTAKRLKQRIDEITSMLG